MPWRAALKTVPGVKVVEEENVPETTGRLQDDGIDDQSRRCQADPRDLLRLLRPSSSTPPRPILKSIPPCRAAVGQGQGPEERGQLLRLPRPGALHQRRRRGPLHQDQQDRLRRGQAHRVVLRNINSFLTGARTVNPTATVQVIFTGDWSMPVREAEATNALVDAGCDVITCHVDGPKVVIQTAEGRGVKTCGHNASQASLAPKGFITGAEYKWETIYKELRRQARQGRDAAQHHLRRLRPRHGAEHALRRRRRRGGRQGRHRGHRRR